VAAFKKSKGFESTSALNSESYGRPIPTVLGQGAKADSEAKALGVKVGRLLE
jgi:hypothetical protein